MKRRLFLPQALAAWISANLTDLGPVEKVQIRGCQKIPFWWIPGNRNMRGLTLWSHIYITDGNCAIDSPDRITVELIFHEMVHVRQFRKSPLWFPVKYLLNHLRYGYTDNPAEVEARSIAAQLARRYFG